MTDAVQFKVSRARILLMGLVLGPLMTTAGVLLLLAALFPDALPLLTPMSPFLWFLYLVAGVAGTTFFGYCTVLWLTFLLKPTAGLVIDAEGFTDTSSALASGRTTWDQVLGWHLHRVQQQTNLCVVVQDPAVVLARLGPVARFLSRGNIKLIGTPVCIGLNSLRGRNELVVEAFQQHHDQWLRQNAGTPEA
ncbi:STM3941 family protein [Promicromonospora kroppenstedtii]|uniref:STM3941 family protein n=1 Tax=Promicromonospora kroppenstedtii TaxID=440482 RepID=UPI0004B1FDAC|nr:STM3941 family protein [Promicromonospora kroppenstedtii]